jgi:CRP/FNR family transcriptional regulator, cyclic AMP receptor protein
MAGQEFEKSLKAGELLFKQGDPGNEMFLIRSGKIKITRSAGAIEKTLAVLKEGDFFGEMAVIDGSPRSAAATAIEETMLMIVDREAFNSQLKNNPMIAYVLETMSRRLRETNKQVEFLLIRDEMRRVVAMLVSMAKERGANTPDGVVIDFPYDYATLGGMVGMEAHKTEEIIKKLLSLNLIKIEDRKLIMPSLNDIDEYLRYITLKEKFSS